jgi:hypothetical protein
MQAGSDERMECRVIFWSEVPPQTRPDEQGVRNGARPHEHRACKDEHRSTGDRQRSVADRWAEAPDWHRNQEDDDPPSDDLEELVHIAIIGPPTGATVSSRSGRPRHSAGRPKQEDESRNGTATRRGRGGFDGWISRLRLPVDARGASTTREAHQR